MWADVRAAFAFLTILPVGQANVTKPGRAFSFFPLVGAVIGLVVAAVASIRFLSPDLVAFLTLTTWVILTGGLHLDGFADSCDGLLATAPPERRLEIMKDPHAGSWAIVGVVLLLLGKWIALRTVLTVQPLLLIVPPVVGRWAMVWAVAGFHSARPIGLAAYFRDGFGQVQVMAATYIAVTAWGIVIALLHNYGRLTFLCFIVTMLTVLIVGKWAANRLGGGLTGDVYGALCELVELLCLIVLSAA